MYDLINFDRRALLFLNGLGTPGADHFWLLMSDRLFWIPFYIILLYLIFRNFSRKNFLYLLVFTAIGIAVSDQLAGIFKNGVMRLRPCHDPYLITKMRMITCGGEYGFYSSHASNSMFVAVFLTMMLGRRLKFLPIILMIWAVLVSYSRIYLGVHFPLDVLFGMAAGFLLGGLFSTMARKVVYRN